MAAGKEFELRGLAEEEVRGLAEGGLAKGGLAKEEVGGLAKRGLAEEEVGGLANGGLAEGGLVKEEGFNIKMAEYGLESNHPLDPFLETADVKLETVSSFILDCPLCHQSFNEMSNLNAHIVSCADPSTNEEEKKFESKPGAMLSCEDCQFVPGNNKGAKMALERHKFKVHGGNICKECDFKAATYFEINQHSISAHIKNSVKCGDCKKYFASANQLRSHTKVVHSPDIVPCPRCKVKFGNVQKLEIHLPFCTVFPCDLCEYGAQSESSLEQHKRFKHEGIRYNCDLCTYVTGFESQLAMHMQSKHKNNKKHGTHPCDQCKMKCITPAGLELHKQRKHSDDRVIPIGGVQDAQGVIRFQCDLCVYKATTNGNMMMHKKNKH